jgi:pterin-4a-carbinolamine dehydratase
MTQHSLRRWPSRNLAHFSEKALFRVSPQQPHSSRSEKLHVSSFSSMEKMEPTEQGSPSQQEDKSSVPQNSPEYDPNKPSIETPVDDKGILLKRNLVISSAVKEPSSLITGLSELLHRPQRPVSDPLPTRATYWTLEPKGDAITRVFAFTTGAEARRFRDQISTTGDKMNHHASTDLEQQSSGAPSGLTLVTVKCTTHRPAGLSMRDVRLAHRINELADMTK